MLTLPGPSARPCPKHSSVWNPQGKHGVFAYSARPVIHDKSLGPAMSTHHIIEREVAVSNLVYTCLATNSFICASCKLLPERPTTNTTGSSPAFSSGYLYEK